MASLDNIKITSEMLNLVAGLPTEITFENLSKETRREICEAEEELYVDFLAAFINSCNESTGKKWVHELFEFNQTNPFSQPWKSDLLRIEVLEEPMLITPDVDKNFQIVLLVKKTNQCLSDGFSRQSTPIDLSNLAGELLSILLNINIHERTEYIGALYLAIQSLVLCGIENLNESRLQDALKEIKKVHRIGIDVNIFEHQVEICLERYDQAVIILEPLLNTELSNYFPRMSPLETAENFLEDWKGFPLNNKWRLPWWKSKSAEYWGLVSKLLRYRSVVE